MRGLDRDLTRQVRRPNADRSAIVRILGEEVPIFTTDVTNLPVARAELAAARSQLLRQYVGLGPATLGHRELWPGTTPASALSRIARRDDDAACSVETRADRNPMRAHIPSRGVDVDAALTSLLLARARLLSAVAGLHATTPVTSPSPVLQLLARCRDLDRRWARRLEWWNEEQHGPFEIGPTPVLLSAMRAARKELLTALALLPPGARLAWRQCLVDISSAEQHLLVVLDATQSLRDPSGWEPGWDDAWRHFHDTHHAVVTRLEERDALDPDLYRAVTCSIDRDRALAFAIRSR